MELRGKQKQYLKKEAHHMNPLFQVGKGGLNEEMLYQIGEALEKRELLKIALLQNTDEETEDVAAVIEEKTASESRPTDRTHACVVQTLNQRKESSLFDCR